ncbi:TetR/AcrR family transcriptional regulator [Aureibacillus halotolerans]|uniref:TetR family transcriptional regulator n=1 Tax=Aureibacillus halotolerans TaxID=1508390 RepID=A0A4R6U4G6_9BACI|nr:TetR/AcrR family transcriptional regulator [Aureibacillus halotolerans]TDQ40382.1 TetR family transcriptional regulator [Aureibacillus halotolerans]
MPRTREENDRIRQETSEKIRTAAMDIFIERGYHDASIDDIANKARVSKGLLYNYYKGKEALLATMVQHRIDEIDEVMRSATTLDPPSEQLRYIVDGALNGVKRNPEVYRFYLHLQTQPKEDLVLFKQSQLLNDAMAQQFELQCDIFMAMGVPHPRMQSLYFSSTLHGMMFMLTAYPNSYPVTHMKKQIIEQFCNVNDML